MKQTKSYYIKYFFLELFLLFIVIISLYPLAWTFLNSFKSDPMMDPGFKWPAEFTFRGYKLVFVQLNVVQYFLNSLYVSFLSTIISIISVSLGAYVVARKHFYGKTLFVTLLTCTMFLPSTAITYPIYKLVKTLNLFDTREGLILLYSMSNIVISFFVVRGYFLTIPGEIEEAGRIDGCNQVQAMLLVFPIALPGILTAAIMAFMGFWNEFYFATLILRTESLMTIPVLIAQFSQGYNVDYTGTFAAIIVIIILPLLLYCFCSKYFLSALSGGAVKG